MLNVGLLDGLLGGAGMIITSDGWDHSRKFPAFSTRPGLSLVKGRDHVRVNPT